MTQNQVPFSETQKEPRKRKSTYSPKEKYLIACKHLDGETHREIASRVDRDPVDIYQTLRAEWVKTLCYAISIERGLDERETELRWGQ